MYEEYSKNPEVTMQRMFYEAMEDVLPDMKIIIDSGDGVQKLLPIEPFSGENSGETKEDAEQQPDSDAAAGQNNTEEKQ